jgi:hypothetical protein
MKRATKAWEKKLATGALEERPRAPGETAEDDEQEEVALDLVAQLRKKEREEGMVRAGYRVNKEGICNSCHSSRSSTDPPTSFL